MWPQADVLDYANQRLGEALMLAWALTLGACLTTALSPRVVVRIVRCCVLITAGVTAVAYVVVNHWRWLIGLG